MIYTAQLAASNALHNTPMSYCYISFQTNDTEIIRVLFTRWYKQGGSNVICIDIFLCLCERVLCVCLCFPGFQEPTFRAKVIYKRPFAFLRRRHLILQVEVFWRTLLNTWYRYSSFFLNTAVFLFNTVAFLTMWTFLNTMEIVHLS